MNKFFLLPYNLNLFLARSNEQKINLFPKVIFALTSPIIAYTGARYGKFVYDKIITNPLIYPAFIRKFIFNKHFNSTKNKKINDIFFSDIGGYTDIKTKLMEIIADAKNPKTKTTNMTGILLERHPGTGKTYLAQALANESGLPIALINKTDILSSPYLGNAEKEMVNLLEEAKNEKPCIIFIDEIETFLTDQNKEDRSFKDVNNNVKNILLTYMDGAHNMQGVILIGATNNTKDIDSAFMGPGRFEYNLQIELPEFTDRIDIIRILLRKYDLFTDQNITPSYIAEITSSFSAADLNKLFKIIKKKKDKTTTHINKKDITEAYLECSLGRKSNRIINEEEKNNTAIHQTGHALISYILNKSNSSYYNFDFVTITPRGRSLGSSHEKNPIKSLISEISKELIEKETLYKKDFEKIIDKYEKDFNINL
jgi:cell division protease FtsH